MTAGGARILVVSGGRAAKGIAELTALGVRAQGAVATDLDLVSLSLPMFSGEAGDESVARLRGIVAQSDGMLLVVPEVYGAVTPVAANALAWIAHDQVGSRRLLAAKPVGLISPAPFGGTGLLCLGQLVSTLASMGAVVVPYPLALGETSLVGDQLLDPSLKKRVEELGGAVATFASRLT